MLSSCEGVLLSEEGAVQLPRLRGREPRLRQHLHGFVSDFPLLLRERRHVAAPAQTSPNVRVDPRLLTRDLVSEAVQRTHLLEERLELRVFDRHDRGNRTSLDHSPASGTPLDEPLAHAPLVLPQEHAATTSLRRRSLGSDSLRQASDRADQTGMPKRSLRDLLRRRRAEKKALSPEMRRLMDSFEAQYGGHRDSQDAKGSNQQKADQR